ncbi:MAG TPA: hypothetical protein DGT21_20775 [Armatimonadetes bacterium]|jgi:type II secretory pathway component GspD/PulD (secretin)|nr:hypothetical protein [Armatimonadota bacterium]
MHATQTAPAGSVGALLRASLLCLCITLLAAGPALSADGPQPPGPPSTAAPGPGQKPKGSESAEKTSPVIEVTRTEAGVSVYAIKADARQLLIRLAEKADLRLIVDDTVDRTLTINLIDKQPQQIIDHIVNAYGLSQALVCDCLIISEGLPRSPSSYLMGDIAAVTTRYVQPAQAKDLLPPFLQGHVKTNLAQNSVVLSAPTPVLRKFEDDIRQFDVPAAQIMLNVIVVELTDMDFDEFSMRLGWDNHSLGGSTDSRTGLGLIKAIVELPTTFRADLLALVRTQRARVRSNPSIATVSGRPASIFIGEEQYLSTPVSMPGEYSSKNSIDAGVTLSMTPLTGGNDQIILQLEQEVSTLGAPDPTTRLPNKTTRTASTTVRVKDGSTIVIGGLNQDEARTVHRKIPVLGDIPLVGKLFRSKRQEKTNVDLAIFITAEILSPTGHLPAEREREIMDRMGVNTKETAQ